jgi:hypothetical protein
VRAAARRTRRIEKVGAQFRLVEQRLNVDLRTLALRLQVLTLHDDLKVSFLPRAQAQQHEMA